MSKKTWNELNRQITACQACPRLRAHCQAIAVTKRKSYQDQSYWGLPVPNFGSDQAALLVVGLAPAAHGANRTGRMFTGDRSGLWLFRAMHRAGFANQPDADNRQDGLQLIAAAITAIAHCAPPDNKPTNEELANCQPFLKQTLMQTEPTVIVALGGLAWNSTIRLLGELGWFEIPRPKPKFAHGRVLELQQGRCLVASYHPSQQNTFTGRLTEPMLDEVFTIARQRCRATGK